MAKIRLLLFPLSIKIDFYFKTVLLFVCTSSNDVNLLKL